MANNGVVVSNEYVSSGHEMDILCRRSFIKGFVERFGVCAGLGCALACTPAGPPPARLLPLGRAADFPEGETELADLRLLVRRAGSSFCVLSLTCTHQTCVVRRTGSGFSCPCHGSTFGADGEVYQGPARDPLPYYRLSRDGDLLIAHLSEVVSPDWRLAL